MHSFALLATVLALGASASPLQRRQDNDWTPQLRTYYQTAGEKIATVQRQPNFPNLPPCDLSTATMPSSSTPLPAPDAGLELVHVAIGRGTQNYTCADSTAASVPVAVGALATLFNASCVAATYPDILSQLPGLALAINLPASGGKLGPANIDLSGEHYFSDNTTPAFDLNHASASLGLTFHKKLAAVPAPADAPKGPNGLGSVPWLKLQQKSGVGNVVNVYRLNTAGGVAPKDCSGQPSSFQVQYAAEYWCYGKI